MPKSCKVILDRMVHKGAMTEEEREKIMRNLKGIEWHPYPQEKPTMEEKRYIVTALYGDEHKVCIAWWANEKYCFGIFTDRITAWAELPEPYEGKEGGE